MPAFLSLNRPSRTELQPPTRNSSRRKSKNLIAFAAPMREIHFAVRRVSAGERAAVVGQDSPLSSVHATSGLDGI